MANSTILVVDDEPSISEVVTLYLQRAGYTVRHAHDGRAALAELTNALPDLVILDIMLPQVDGFEITRRLRAEGSTPVILLTARSEEADRIAGLELGADDYVVKPFSPAELVSRVRAVLRRMQPNSPNSERPSENSSERPGERPDERPNKSAREVASVRPGDGPDPAAGVRSDAPLAFDGLRIDLLARQVQRLVGGAEQAVALTAKEFDLLWFLASHPRQVFNRDQLLAHVWGETQFIDPSTVTVHIRRLREKVEANPAAPRFLHTVWGVGYKFEP